MADDTITEKAKDPANFAPDGGGVDGQARLDIDDISTPAKVTLGDYLGDITSKNAYPVQGDSAKMNVSYFNELGTPMPQAPDHRQRNFMDDNAPREGVTHWEAASVSALDSLVDKTSQSDGNELLPGVDGNDLGGAALRSINTPTPQPGVEEKISQSLKINRFTPSGDSPYIEQGNYTDGMYSIQQKFGEHDTNAPAIDINLLAQISLAASLRAAGAQNASSADPKTATKTTVISGGTDQLSIQVGLSKLKERNYTSMGRVFNDLIDTMGLEDGDLYKLNELPGPESEGNAEPWTMNEEGIDGWKKTEKGWEPTTVPARYGKSYGQLNSYLAPFDGPMPIAMIALAAVTVLAVMAASVLLGAVLKLIMLIPGGSVAMRDAGDAGHAGDVLPYGQRWGSTDYGDNSLLTWILKELGLLVYTRSEEPFHKAALLGTLQFFSQIVGRSAGYYISVNRNALRDTDQIERTLGEAMGGGIVGVVEGIFLIIESFKTSATFKLLVTLQRLGDQVYLSGGVSVGPFNSMGGWGMDFSPLGGESQYLPDGSCNLQNLQTFSRENSDNKRLAWRFGSLPSAYLLPRSLLMAQMRPLGGAPLTDPVSIPGGGVKVDPLYDRTEKWEKWRRKSNGSPLTRIPTQHAKALEQALESLYMPFHFKDLRTNEILAFHAFVENISDSYTPKYTAVSGFGRMDDVQIYNKTTRQLGVTFYIISTNEEDFDEMWYAINRFVAMVYPQWSRGTVKKSGNHKFIMPFTQLPTASPVIRMRLGDLFKSNMSGVGLRRQFGFGYGPDSFIMAEEDATDAEKAAELAKLLNNEAEDRMIEFEAKSEILQERVRKGPGILDPEEALVGSAVPYALIDRFNLKGDGWVPSDSLRLKPGKYTILTNALSAAANPGTYRKKKYKISEPRDCKIVGYGVEPIIPESSGESRRGARRETRALRRRKGYYKVAIYGDDVRGNLMGDFTQIGAPLFQLKVMSGDDLTLDHIDYMKVLETRLSAGSTPLNPFSDAQTTENSHLVAEQIASFFSPENNAIVRAFEEAGGTGIAGVITQLDMDWNWGGNMVWETNPGKKAPHGVKITISFAPMHDLPLGIADDGAMSAPAYPVGDVVNGLYGNADILNSVVSYFAEKKREMRLGHGNDDMIHAQFGEPTPVDTPE